MEDEIYEIIAKVVAGETLSDEERQDLKVWREEHLCDLFGNEGE